MTISGCGAWRKSGRVDGIIVIGQSDQKAALEMVAQAYAPLVVWGASLPSRTYVTVGTDNPAGGALATRHLIAKGRKRLIFLGDDQPLGSLRLYRALYRGSGRAEPRR